MKTVFIASHQQGFESDPVIDALNVKGVSVFRYNQEDGTNVSLISASLGKNYHLDFECDGRKISSQDIGVAWFQQPSPYCGQPMNENECLQRVSLDAMHFGAFSTLECPWFNHFGSVTSASNKLFQLVHARNVGLPLMPTLMSNQPNAIREFAQRNRVIAKNIATPWIAQGEQTTAAYAKLVHEEWLQNDAELSPIPIIYQAFCERVRDYRVVAISGKYYAVYCIPNQDQMEDVRRSDHTGDGYSVCEMDPLLMSKLGRMMQQLGVDYCSADFMQDARGNIYFLEANICGAWWWVDKYYNGEICQCITDQIIQKMQ